MMTPHDKERTLRGILRSFGHAAVAFSGGVDSTYLLKTAHDILGDNVIALTAVSPAFPDDEDGEARRFCCEEGIRQIRVTFDMLAVPGLARNPTDRCYLCKKALFTMLRRIAREEGMTARGDILSEGRLVLSAGDPVVLDGSNVSDTGDYRPGFRAISELGILSPLLEAGLTKDDIRALSKEKKIPTWDKPPMACLATRIPCGDDITEEKLRRIGQAEAFIRSKGIRQIRVRAIGNGARLECEPADFPVILKTSVRTAIIEELTRLGFRTISLDLKGYRTGSLNDIPISGPASVP